jgi:hypothetical protein
VGPRQLWRGIGAGRAWRRFNNRVVPMLPNLRFPIVAAGLTFALLLADSAFAETANPQATPKIDETQDAEIKAEYLEAIPYKPCPANVRFLNGRQACLGLPGYPYARPYNSN